MSESPLIYFYRGDGTDHAGRRLDEILGWPDTHLEAVHDYIQWLFPLHAPSRFNPQAPILTADDVAVFRQPGPCQDNFLRAFRRMLGFYGLECDDEDPEDVYVDPSLLFELRSRIWLTPGNHNYLRLSRILTSTRLLGCQPYAQGLFHYLERLYRDAGGRIGQETHAYWRKAVEQ
jgi:hypothetical protein